MSTKPKTLSPIEIAKNIRSIYNEGYSFPEWVASPVFWPHFNFMDTVVYYERGARMFDVVSMIKYREPCNIGMFRFYDAHKLHSQLGYAYGSYSLSTIEKLMPNIAIYCKANVNFNRKLVDVHVINLTGVLLDDETQPDFLFYRSIEQIVVRYTKIWYYALIAAKENKCSVLHIYDMTDNTFAGAPWEDFNKNVFEPAFKPLLPLFEGEGIAVEGYDWDNSVFNVSDLSVDISNNDLTKTMFVNWITPWSLIGNGNAGEKTYNSYWGQMSNMSVLGWLQTNPHIRFKPVGSPKICVGK